MPRLTALVRPIARDAFLVLATLAIALKIMLPAGFMPGATPVNGLPFALVLCTADGAKVVQPGEAHKTSDEPAGATHDQPCPFAAQGALVPPPTVASVGETLAVAYVEAPVPLARSIAPGRGLAAPPPPKTGPPSIA